MRDARRNQLPERGSRGEQYVPADAAWLVELNRRGDDDPRLERVRALIEKT